MDGTGIFTHGVKGFGGMQKSAQKGFILFIAVFERQLLAKLYYFCDVWYDGGLTQSTTRKGVFIETEYCKIKKIFCNNSNNIVIN